ncbi:sensor histidine kinase [Streptomyces sp. NPDC050546]|uniref:sensor histidine kinase n=1 Tax=Streptomyces sp. NPDC050546 TaxID=3365628 RepID=UPI0037A0A6E0
MAYVEAVRARAEHAERTREEEARRRVTEERMRIARDLHDVVAHHLVLANLQARTVTRLVRTRPDEADRIANDLSETTALALGELKSTVGLLRSAGDTESAADPAPGLARLPELVDSFKSAGLTVTVITEGEPRPVGAATDVTAYRILQEALTNVTKHAGTDSAEVRIAYTGDRLRVRVSNGGAAASREPGSGGFGLLGMRERAASVGGPLRAGSLPEGGFEVVTDLPLRPRSATDAAGPLRSSTPHAELPIV